MTTNLRNLLVYFAFDFSCVCVILIRTWGYNLTNGCKKLVSKQFLDILSQTQTYRPEDLKTSVTFVIESNIEVEHAQFLCLDSKT